MADEEGGSFHPPSRTCLSANTTGAAFYKVLGAGQRLRAGHHFITSFSLTCLTGSDMLFTIMGRRLVRFRAWGMDVQPQ
jgi:hypothetical protein